MTEKRPRTPRVLKALLWEVKAPDGSLITVTSNHRQNAVYEAERVWNKKHPSKDGIRFGGGTKITCLTPERPAPLSENKAWPTGQPKYSRSGLPRIAYIYVVKCGPFVKVGVTQNVAERVSALRGGCPYPIRFVVSHAVRLAAAGHVERATMEMLHEHHHSREWFKCSAKHAEYALMMVMRRNPDAQPDAIPSA